MAKRLAERLWAPAVARSDLSLPAGPFNQVLTSILALEAPLATYARLPFGLSVIAIGIKA